MHQFPRDTPPRDDENAQLRDRIAELERQLAQRIQLPERQRLSERHYLALADSMPQLVWATDANGSHFYFNQRWYEYTGLSEEESLGFGFINALHPDDHERTLERWQRAWRNGESYDIEYRFRRYDGVYHWFIGRAMPVYGRDGTIVEWVGTCTDIDEQKRTSEALRFLAEASTLLASSLDYETTLAQLAQLAVPHIADWCAVDVFDTEGTLQRLAVAHVDPSKVELAHELHRRTPFDPDAPGGVAKVVRTGEPDVITSIDDDLIRRLVRDPEMQNILLRLGLRSSMVVPLTTRDRTLGAITFVSAESGTNFTDSDLRLAQDLARRAAIAIDNARLYRELRRFRTTLDQTHDSVFMFDPDSLRFFYVNQGATDQVGYTRQEILQMTPLDVKPAFNEAGFRAMLAPLVAGEISQHTFETVHRHKDGHDIPVEIALQYVAPSDVKGRFVAIVRDITERRLADEKMRASEERYRFLAETIPAQVWTALPDGTITFISGRGLEYFGAPPEQVTGEQWLHFVCPEDLPQVRERWAHSVSTGTLYDIEFRLRRYDGQYRWHLSRAQPMCDSEGAITQWFGVNTDIDDQKRAEADRDRLIQALDSERARLTTLFHQAPAFIATVNGPDHVFDVANALYYQLVGHRDIVGKPVREALPEVVEQGFIDLLDQVYRTGEPFVGTEMPILLQRSPGSPPEERYVNFVYQPIRESDGSISGIFAHGVDVTETVLARQDVERKAEELARLARALESSNRELDQFAYITSHDLKAPLRGIANLSQWIEEDLGEQIPEDVRTHLELLRGRVYRMEALIDGILQYSRVGRIGGGAEHVEVRKLLDDIIDLLAPPENVTIEIAPDMPTLVTERLLLQQVFSNLIGNAIKHHPGPDARIHISARRQNGTYEFIVADNGPGIAPQYHDRIFGIFQTLASRDKVEGSGLGLALVKKIVEHRHGRIWLESAEGEGAMFHFTWPTRMPTEGN